jgi:hypothetical protein
LEMDRVAAAAVSAFACAHRAFEQGDLV